MPPTPIVEFRNVTKRFGPTPGALVLEGISLAVNPGDFVSLIGPSGCGKSTLLRLVAGLSPVSAGALTVAGGAPGGRTTEQAFIFQESTLLPWLTVAENVELPQKLRGVPGQQRAAARERILKLVGLADKSAAYPRELSGGQKMRVSVARALSLTPSLLLLDEPFGALDEMTRERLNEELLAIRAQQNWTAFFVTHSVAEAVFLSTRILVMGARPGRIHADLSISLPYPRTAETRLHPQYLQRVAEVSRALRHADSANS